MTDLPSKPLVTKPSVVLRDCGHCGRSHRRDAMHSCAEYTVDDDNGIQWTGNVVMRWDGRAEPAASSSTPATQPTSCWCQGIGPTRGTHHTADCPKYEPATQPEAVTTAVNSSGVPLCEHGVAPSLLGGRLSCKACADGERARVLAEVRQIIEAMQAPDTAPFPGVLRADDLLAKLKEIDHA